MNNALIHGTKTLDEAAHRRWSSVSSIEAEHRFEDDNKEVERCRTKRD